MSTNFGEPFRGGPDPDEQGGAPAGAAGQAGPAQPALPARRAAGRPGRHRGGRRPVRGSGHPGVLAPRDWAPGNPYAAGGAPAAGNAGSWYAPVRRQRPRRQRPRRQRPGWLRSRRQRPGVATGRPGGYGPGGYGPGAFGGGPDDERRPRRRRMLFAGGSAVIVAALAVAGFSAANAFGSSTLTSAQISRRWTRAWWTSIPTWVISRSRRPAPGWC